MRASSYAMQIFSLRYVLVGRSADMWGLGVLIYEVYNGELRQISDLRNTSKVCPQFKLQDCVLVLHCDGFLFSLLVSLRSPRA